MRRPPLGAVLGEGRCRLVYVHGEDPSLVVKVAKEGHRKINTQEAQVWDKVKDTDAARWLAPVLQSCPDGRWLVMQRTVAATRNEDYPDQVPSGMRDVKRHNWGWIGGEMRCHDYHMLHRGRAGGSTRKARWKGPFTDPRGAAQRRASGNSG